MISKMRQLSSLLIFGFAFVFGDQVQVPMRTVERMTLEANSTMTLTLQDDPDASDEFWTFEAHSNNNNDHLYFTVDMNQPFDKKTNHQVLNHPGIVIFRRDLVANSSKPTIYLHNLANHEVNTIVLARNYSAKYPVPGYANGQANNELDVRFDGDLIRLNFTQAEIGNTSQAGKLIFTYSVYQHYLTEQDFDEEHFLSQLSTTMLKLDDIVKTGRLVDTNFVNPAERSPKELRALFGSYPGTAVVFSVVVTTVYPNINGSTEDLAFSSVYATTSTYACQFDQSKPLHCKTMWENMAKVLCALSLFIGIFLGFAGHRYFIPQQFFMGLYFTAFWSYVAATDLMTKYDYEKIMGLAIGIGIGGALIWVLVWYLLGIPILSTSLPVIAMGFLLGATLVFLPPLNTFTMTKNSVFWATQSAFVVGCLIAILPFTKNASILSGVIIGSFVCFVPTDYFIGSSLKYILVNFARRIYVEDFNKAVTHFPFQTNDIYLVCGWIGFIVVAFMTQYLREKNRAPFPPNPYQLRRWRMEEESFLSENAINNAAEDETQPLLIPPASRNERPMSPTSRSPRGEQQGRPAVVGLIRGSVNQYGSTVIAASPGTIRNLESPTLYATEPRGVAPVTSPRRFWNSRQNDERQCMSTSVEARNIFQPPADHLSHRR